MNHPDRMRRMSNGCAGLNHGAVSRIAQRYREEEAA